MLAQRSRAVPRAVKRQRRAAVVQGRWDKRTIVAAVAGVVERIAVLAVVATGRGGGLLAQVLLAASLEARRIHGGWRRCGC